MGSVAAPAAEPRSPASQVTQSRGSPGPTHCTGKGVEAGEGETKLFPMLVFFVLPLSRVSL